MLTHLEMTKSILADNHRPSGPPGVFPVGRLTIDTTRNNPSSRLNKNNQSAVCLTGHGEWATGLRLGIKSVSHGRIGHREIQEDSPMAAPFQAILGFYVFFNSITLCI